MRVAVIMYVTDENGPIGWPASWRYLPDGEPPEPGEVVFDDYADYEEWRDDNQAAIFDPWYATHQAEQDALVNAADAAVALHETSGPTNLTIDAVTDGQVLVRSGETIIGQSGVAPTGSAGGDLSGSYPNPAVSAIHETSGPTKLTIGAVGSGQGLARSGSTLIGVDLVDLTASAPANVTRSTASVGVATDAARSDHKHDISSAAPSQGIGGGNSAGSASTVALSDHNHALRETSGPTDLTIGAVAAGQGLARSGTTLIGVDLVALTAVAPVDVTKATAAVGVGTTAARSDHKHNISTAVAGAIAVGDSASEGTATSLARSDHVHSLAAPSAPVDVTKATASAGVASTVARSDHKHDISTAAPSQGIGGGSSEGTATSLARSDHNHALRETSGPTNLTIGAVADGQVFTRSGVTIVGTTVPSLSAAAPVDVDNSAAAVGVGTTAARSDHKHDIAFAAPSTGIGGGNTSGSATTVALSDP